MKNEYDIVVIGGGSGGMAAALEAKISGVSDILILETEDYLGGVLRQCIHSGFGLHVFKQEMTGPEYAARFIERIKAENIEYALSSPVLEIRPDKTIVTISREYGYREIKAKAVVIATGCRERSAGAISLAGTRPSGVMTAGTAQKYINIDGYMVGKSIVILGSGDIGLIMARRLTLEGAKVECVAEIMPYSNGLTRNVVQCLEDFDIPLYLSHTVSEIHGRERVEAVTILKVDKNFMPIPGTQKKIGCDTLLLSVGLIPESEMIRDGGAEVTRFGGVTVDQNMQSTLDGVFACGNVVHVHDLVDFVTGEGARAGACAARYVLSKLDVASGFIPVSAGSGVSYVVPQRIVTPVREDAELFFRVSRPFKSSSIKVFCGEKLLLTKKRPFMIPAEMERITIKNELFGEISGQLRLEAQENE